jgi:hypothetical protein
MHDRIRQPLTGRSNSSLSKKSKFSGSQSMTPSMIELNKKVINTYYIIITIIITIIG